MHVVKELIKVGKCGPSYWTENSFWYSQTVSSYGYSNKGWFNSCNFDSNTTAITEQLISTALQITETSGESVCLTEFTYHITEETLCPRNNDIHHNQRDIPNSPDEKATLLEYTFWLQR
jgi:hypothetical protein